LNLINNISTSESEIFDHIKFYKKLKSQFKSKAKNDIYYKNLSKQIDSDIFNYLRNHIIKKFVLFPDKYNLKLLWMFVFYKISPFSYLRISETMHFIIKCLTLYNRN
jgi:hypothetical protein